MNGGLKEKTRFLDTNEYGCFATYYYDSISSTLNHQSTMNCGKQPFLFYYPKMKLALEGFILDAAWNQVGKWTEWYENGNKKKEIFFDDNKPNFKVGTWLYWDEKGNLIKQEVYENNKLIDTKSFLPKNQKEKQ